MGKTLLIPSESFCSGVVFSIFHLYHSILLIPSDSLCIPDSMNIFDKSLRAS